MYRGFNLSISNEFISEISSNRTDQMILNARCPDAGERLYNDYCQNVKTVFDSFLKGSVLDGGKLQKNWFPSVNADVFISHSHADVDIAKNLAGWLSITFGLNSFIDSCVWGHADDLLKQIDNQYCWQEESKTYNYMRRNKSTSHVHMMLSTALGMMIDSTECIIFLNTPNSITSKDVMEEKEITKTKSPWIFSEIATTHIVEKKRKKLIVCNESFSRKAAEIRPDIEHSVDLTFLTPIEIGTLETWKQRYSVSQKQQPLEILYEIT